MNTLQNKISLLIAIISIISCGTLAAQEESSGEWIEESVEVTMDEAIDMAVDEAVSRADEAKIKVVELIDEVASNPEACKAKIRELKFKLKVNAQKVIDQL